MKMLPPPPPYVLPLGGAVYWLAGGPLLSSSAPPQHNILQLVLSAPLNKPYSQKRSVFDESPETIFNAQILNRQCRNKIKSNKKKKKNGVASAIFSFVEYQNLKNVCPFLYGFGQR